MTDMAGKWVIIVETYKFFQSYIVKPPKLVTRDCPKTLFVKAGFHETRYRKDQIKYKVFDDPDRASSAYKQLRKVTGVDVEEKLKRQYDKACEHREEATKQLIEKW